MQTLIRWGKFNLVGILGFALQLGTLSLLDRIFPRHYLLDTAAAIELTLLHNFTWHVHYTWKDRMRHSVAAQFVRYQLTSGVVSIAGNLVLMRLLVQGAHMRVVPANVVAVLSCSLLNFAMSNLWAFAAASPPEARCCPAEGCPAEDRRSGHSCSTSEARAPIRGPLPGRGLRGRAPGRQRAASADRPAASET
jgi:putative flippase GtrA